MTFIQLAIVHSSEIIPNVTTIIERSSQKEDKNGGLSQKLNIEN